VKLAYIVVHLGKTFILHKGILNPLAFTDGEQKASILVIDENRI
jgi:hypothetical protein